MRSNSLSILVCGREINMNRTQLSEQVIRDNRDAVENVGRLLVQTDALQNQHGLMFSQFSKLSGKTTELTELTHNAVSEINGSFADLKVLLNRERQSKSRYVWDSWVLWVLQRLLRCEFCTQSWQSEIDSQEWMLHRRKNSYAFLCSVD